MKATDRSQLFQALHDRRETVADSWHSALISTPALVPLKAGEIRQQLAELTEQAIGLLLTDSVPLDKAQEIGVALARLHDIQPEALGCTQEVLARGFVQDLPPEQSVALQPRLAVLLGGLALGFFQRAREMTLPEQEQIQDVLTGRLQATERTPWEAHKPLEGQTKQWSDAVARVNEELRETEERYRNLVQNINDLVFAMDTDGNILWINSVAEKMIGYKPEEIVGHHYAEYVHSDDVPCLLTSIPKALNGEPPEAIPGIGEDAEYRLVRRDGRVSWVSTRSGLLTDTEGRIIGFSGVTRDITGRKRAEEALRHRSEELEALREIGLELTAQLDLGTLLDSIVSRAMELLAGNASGLALYDGGQDMLKVVVNAGRAVAELGNALRRGEGISGIIWETGEPLVLDDYQTATREGAILESPSSVAVLGVPIVWGTSSAEGEFLGTLVVKADPPRTFSSADVELLDMFATQAAIAIRNARLYEALQQELAERRRTEEALQRAYDELELRVQARTAELAQANAALQAEAAEREQAIEALRKSEELFRTIVEMTPSFLVIADAEGRTTYASPNCNEMLGYTQQELLGEVIWWVHEDDSSKAREIYSRVFQERVGGRDFEYKAVRKDGEVWYASSSWEPLADEEGTFKGVVLQTSDITARKRAEEQVIQAERMAAMGKLATSVAHEINNPLQAIRSNLELALDFDLEPDEQKGYCDIVRREVERLARITRRVLDFAQPTEDTRYPVSIVRLMQKMLSLLGKQLELARVQVTTDFSDNLPRVFVAPDQIVQVLLNLGVNAIEAMPDGGHLHIAAHAHEDEVVLTFVNDGPPLSAELVARMFDPFFTTKPNGTGLGLSISHRIVLQHGGTISVRNLESNDGVAFAVTLPSAHAFRHKEVLV